MNCEKLERKILLAESGELSNRQLEKLEEHLSACRRCQEYRKTVLHIISTSKDALPGGEPSPVVMSRIRAVAEERITPKPIVFRLRFASGWDYIRQVGRPVARVLAYAAVFALVVVGWFMFLSNRQADRISELNTILAMMSEDDLGEVGYSDGSGGDQELRSLANRLLLMEGLEHDDFTDVELWELPPTALRLHNIAGLQQKKRV